MAVKFKDYYDVLGVARTASADEIKQAFRKLARIHHPDVAKNKQVGEAKFKEINEAYEVLGDPEKRKRYDELGANWDQQPGGMAAEPPPGRGRAATGRPGADYEFDGTGFSDFFESFFGGSRDGYSSFRGGVPPEEEEGVFAHPGRDVEADLLVTLEEALHGSRRQVTLRRPQPDGEERSDTYNVKIPAGVREGQRIRLAGQGSAGRGGGAAGDLYLRVRLALHPDFSVNGPDLHCDLDVAPWEAVLGTSVKLPTLDGTTALKVPPGTAAGGQLRLRGLGLPRGDGTRGDLYATVRIQVPAVVTPAQKAVWERLAKESDFQARKKPMSKPARRSAARKPAAALPTYTVRAAADVAGVEPELVQFYVENGVVTAVAVVRGQFRLGDDALYELRRIEHYRRHYGVSRHALPLIGNLLREVARLEAALRFHQH